MVCWRVTGSWNKALHAPALWNGLAVITVLVLGVLPDCRTLLEILWFHEILWFEEPEEFQSTERKANARQETSSRCERQGSSGNTNISKKVPKSLDAMDEQQK